jgi:5-methylcytosine-specific restriction enzyme subunit McrC
MTLTEGRCIAEELTSSGRLEILELAQGLEVRASSWVGRIDLGNVTVTVRPKIPGAPFLHLLRYAYGLRHLSLHREALFATTEWTFQDLIVQQLAAEVEELLARGLHRDYRRELAQLANPRGRIDFQKYAMTAGAGRAVLPCVHHPRTCATLLNRVVLAGLQLAARATEDLDLRARLRRLGQALDIDESPLRLERTVLAAARRSVDRRMISYEPTMILVGLLMESLGIALDERVSPLRLPGFLFDMNRFFQALISRFLREHLADYIVRDEQRLRGMFEFDREQNPRRRSAPTPRPDFVVLHGSRIVAVLDAKYRDLWGQNLPREMLCQLALYALGHGGAERIAVILYPTLDAGATDQTVVLKEPVRGSEMARIVLRPVKLLELEELLRTPHGSEYDRRGARRVQPVARAPLSYFFSKFIIRCIAWIQTRGFPFDSKSREFVPYAA